MFQHYILERDREKTKETNVDNDKNLIKVITEKNLDNLAFISMRTMYCIKKNRFVEMMNNYKLSNIQ